MRLLFAIIASFAWALWLGGLITLFLSVTTLFAADRAIAVEAAPAIFLAFERYQLVLAGVALLATLCWRFTQPSRWITFSFCLLAVATVGAILLPIRITGRMEELRQSGQSGGPEFRRLHGRSMGVYIGESAALAVCGILLPLALAQRPRTGAYEIPPT